MSRAGPGGFRPAHKPLSEPLGRSNRRPGQPGTAPESPLPTQGAQEGSKGRPEPPPEAARSPQEGPQRPRNHAKTMLKPWFLRGFVKNRFRRPRPAQDAPKKAQEAARTAPEEPKSGPERPQSGPRAAKSGPGGRQGDPRRAQERPRSSPGSTEERPRSGPKR